MKQTTKYVGLDVHQDTTVACVRDETNRIITRQILATQDSDLLAFVRGMRGKIHVALEEGTQAQWLYDLFEPAVESVLVCNRRGESARGNKGDWRDAEALSELLWRGVLKTVYHGSPQRSALKEFTRTYWQLVEDCTRVMQRLKALFRARGIKTSGQSVYHPQYRGEWLSRLTTPALRFRAESLYGELDVLLTLRPRAKQAMLTEARRDPAWATLRSIPFLGDVRVAVLLAILQTPWRFRTKRQLWAYSGLSVVTRDSSEYTLADGRPVRRRRAPLTRGLNRNHNRHMKHLFKSAATAATARPGALQIFYQAMLQRGMQPDLARVTLTRKLAALTLHCWKRGERYDPTQLTVQAT